MKLNEEQLQKVVQQLNEVAPDGFVCPICGGKRWSVNNTVFETREFNNGNLFPSGPMSLIPLIVLDCSHCHNTMFLNAVALGIVSQSAEEEQDQNLEKKEEHHG